MGLPLLIKSQAASPLAYRSKLILPRGVEPRLTAYRAAVLPLNEGRVVGGGLSRTTPNVTLERLYRPPDGTAIFHRP